MNMLSSEKFKHTGLAYLLLALVLWCIWWLLLAPLKEHWNQHRERTAELRLEIDRLATHSEINRRSLAGLELQLESLIGQRVIAGPASASVSGHQLQTQVKRALRAAAATVSQIKPRSLSQSEWVHRNQLEVSFRIPAVELESLFTALAEQTPLLHLDLLSLRASTLHNTGPPQLEARVTISSWSLSEPLTQSFSGLKSAPDIPKAVNAVSTVAELAGLFDSGYREKLRNPSADHYRLSAVTVSANARIAIIADLQTGATRRMKEGDMLDGWQIKSIDSARVTLQSGNLQATLTLQQQ